MKSSISEQPEFTRFRMKRLHAALVRRHQVNGGVEEALIKRIEAAFMNQEGAYFLQSQRPVRSRVNALTVGDRRTRAQRCSRGRFRTLVQILTHARYPAANMNRMHTQHCTGVRWRPSKPLISTEGYSRSANECLRGQANLAQCGCACGKFGRLERELVTQRDIPAGLPRDDFAPIPPAPASPET